jgi:hypothetical protein
VGNNHWDSEEGGSAGLPVDEPAPALAKGLSWPKRRAFNRRSETRNVETHLQLLHYCHMSNANHRYGFIGLTVSNSMEKLVFLGSIASEQRRPRSTHRKRGRAE